MKIKYLESSISEKNKLIDLMEEKILKENISTHESQKEIFKKKDFLSKSFDFRSIQVNSKLKRESFNLIQDCETNKKYKIFEKIFFKK